VRISIEQRLVRPRWLALVVPVGSVVVAFLIAAVVLVATGHNPLSTYKQLFQAGFIQQGSLDQTLTVATPLAFTGLAAAAAFRMKLYNIGAEGQMYMGAIVGSGAGLFFGGGGGPSVFVIGAMVIGGCVGGIGWALVPGILRAFFKTNEILTSLLLNYVAGFILTYLIFESESFWRQTKGFNATVFPTGKSLPSSAIWPSLQLHVQGGITVPLGAFLALAAAFVLWALYKRTRFGFELQVMGDSERAARYAGVRMRRKILAVMAVSGAIAGIGGASQVGDFSHSLDGDPNGLQKVGYGYTGIIVAALGRYNPFAVVLIAFLLGGLENAGNTLQGPDFPAGLVGAVQGIILFSALGGELLARHRIRITRNSRPTTAIAAPAKEVAA